MGLRGLVGECSWRLGFPGVGYVGCGGVDRTKK
jgi:hypothetical protein